ncbi:hypothetical protein EMIT0P12_100110 [Pseudomonas sp. IT-P12]
MQDPSNISSAVAAKKAGRVYAMLDWRSIDLRQRVAAIRRLCAPRHEQARSHRGAAVSVERPGSRWRCQLRR